MARPTAWSKRGVRAKSERRVVCATRRHQRVKVVERPARVRDLRRRGLHGRGQPWPLAAMAQAVEARTRSAMDGSAVARRPTSARALFLFLFLNSDPGRSRHIPHALVARRSGRFAFECVCGSCCYNISTSVRL